MLEFSKVPSLKSLCIKRYTSFIISLPSCILLEIKNNPENIGERLQETINKLNATLQSYVPCNIYDVVTNDVLQAIDSTVVRNIPEYWLRAWLPEELTKADVAISLANVVLSSKSKRADISRWSRRIRLVFYENLSKMVNLETLNFACHFSEWQTLERNTKLLRGIKAMKNLRSICLQVACNDKIINAVSETCLQIQVIDVSHSELVTDLSVEYLLKCRQLQALQIYGTSVTAAGHAKLISELPNLRNVGACDNFNLIVKYLDKPFYNNITKLILPDCTNSVLELLVHFFPKIQSLSMHFNIEIPDLTKLQHMYCLKQLQLANASQGLPSSYQFFQTVGQQLIHLHLEFCHNMPLNFLLVVGNSCRLKSLVINECDFDDYDSLVSLETQLNPQSFSTLETIIWNVRDSVTLAELVLSRAVSIRCFQIGSSTSLRHENLENILRANPMKFLKGLMVRDSIDMNMETVQLLLDSCPSLKVISGLETWREIPMLALEAFRDFIRRKNVDLDVSTFWSTHQGCCEFRI